MTRPIFRSTDPERTAAIEAVIAQHRAAIEDLKAAKPADARERRQLKKAVAGREKAIAELRAQLPPTVLDEDAAIEDVLARIQAEVDKLAEAELAFQERLESDLVWALENAAGMIEARFNAKLSHAILKQVEAQFTAKGRSLDAVLRVLTHVYEVELVQPLLHNRWDGGSTNEFSNACEHATRKAASRYAHYTLQYWIADVKYCIERREDAAPA